MIRAALAVLAAVSAAATVHAQSYSSDDLARHVIHRRAIEAVIWGMPAVNFDLMLQAMSSARGKPNQIVYWSRLPDWKNQMLTPNPDVIYVMPFFNTKDAGPMVLEIPPADDGLINGTVMDAWQVPLEDVGPAGVDKGKGGKYLIVPPNHSAAIPDGYIPLPSMNYQGYALLRSILKSGSDADVAKAVTYAKRIKLYPLSQATNPPATTFVDAIDIVYDSTIPYDLRFFQSLDRVVQMEPWLARDKLMVDILKSIGIVKGKPFNPDAQTQDVLKSAAREAKALLESRYEGIFTTSYFEGSRWTMPALPDYIKASQDGFSDPNAYPFDSRGLVFTYAFFTPKHLGEGQFYLMTVKDKDGQNFDGSKTYRLTVPTNAPVNQYWSATIYDRATHALIRDMPRSGRGSQSPGLQKNADGSVDIYFGPKASAGMDSNWVSTKPGGQFEVLFRFYGPEKPLFDKTWKLPDIEKVVEAASSVAPTQTPTRNAIPVTADNFNRAESDLVMASVVKDGGFGKYVHHRELYPVDAPIVRPNRDTLYSFSIFDLDAGPVTIRLPDAGQRFMSLQVIDGEQYTPEVHYGAGRYTFTREKIGTRYVQLGVRILIDPANQEDIKRVHALQDAIKVEQPGGPGRFEVPNWDPASQKKVRDALLALGTTLPDTKRMFGPRDQVDAVRHLIGTALAYGGNPERDALYLNNTPSRNDGKTVHRLTVNGEVPVDGFWSITVYNDKGYLERNPYNTYSLNSITAKKATDGSAIIQFGGCDGKITNCLSTMSGWNYMVRLYRPRAEILNGIWKFPEAQATEAGSRALQ